MESFPQIFFCVYTITRIHFDSPVVIGPHLGLARSKRKIKNQFKLDLRCKQLILRQCIHFVVYLLKVFKYMSNLTYVMFRFYEVAEVIILTISIIKWKYNLLQIVTFSQETLQITPTTRDIDFISGGNQKKNARGKGKKKSGC